MLLHGSSLFNQVFFYTDPHCQFEDEFQDASNASHAFNITLDYLVSGHHQCSGALGKRIIVASFYSSKEAPVLSPSHMNKGTSKQVRSKIRSHGNADCLLKTCQICLSNKISSIWMMSENVLVRVRVFFNNV